MPMGLPNALPLIASCCRDFSRNAGVTTFVNGTIKGLGGFKPSVGSFYRVSCFSLRSLLVQFKPLKLYGKRF